MPRLAVAEIRMSLCDQCQEGPWVAATAVGRPGECKSGGGMSVGGTLQSALALVKCLLCCGKDQVNP